MGEILKKLRTDPIGLVKRGIHKSVVGRVQYKKGAGYDAQRYWGDRLGKWGSNSLRGVGDEGLSEAQNEEMYDAAAVVFRDLVASTGIDLQTARVLEFGVGTAFFADALFQAGLKRFVGVDVTDALFAAHRQRFPATYEFVCANVAEVELNGEFDFAFSIDMIEHIVIEDEFDRAMAKIRDHVKPGGWFIIAPIAKSTGRKLFHTRFWSLEDIVQRFPGWEVGATIPFRYSGIVALRKPAS
jgi:2-polyprenyl-3-methyl-5-hydroxy-6-metoxy-1,4-benzoquinol methylase